MIISEGSFNQDCKSQCHVFLSTARVSVHLYLEL